MDIRTTGGYPTGGWHHVAFTYNGTSFTSGVKIYYDGTSVSLAAAHNTLSATIQTTEVLKLGSGFNGLIDEVLVYNRVLSAAEISTLYNSGSGTESLSYQSSGTFISDVIDTGGNNAFSTLDFSATTTNCGTGALKLQVAGSADNSTWTDYTGPTGNETGLVGLWHMNTDSNSDTTVSDSSTNSNTGTITNATWSESGKLGATTYDALSFDGSGDYVEVGSLSISGTVTLSFWAKPTTGGSNEHVGIMIGSAYAFGWDNVSDRWWVVRSGIGNYYGTTNNVPIDEWSYFTATLNTSSTTVYINGVQDGSVGQGHDGGTVLIGKRDSNMQYFSGLIDEVAIYNRALSANEVLAQYNHGNNGLEINSSFTASGQTIPTSLNTKRYIKYKAYFSTADTAYTPTLNSITVKFTDDTEGNRVISDESDNVFTIGNASAGITYSPDRAVRDADTLTITASRLRRRGKRRFQPGYERKRNNLDIRGKYTFG
jgi:hypothetical protein